MYPDLELAVFELPVAFTWDHYVLKRSQRPPFVQHATIFQDIVIRCIRHAFASFPASVGRVFFSKDVALPFTRWRMFKHGVFHPPISWYEVKHQGVKGLWISYENSQSPDVVVYYCHGGGFSMGSAYFYLEPLIALVALLKTQYRAPAVFALEYSLVPDQSYPTQLDEICTGYQYVLSRVKDQSSRICVAGDSAGGTLVLSMLLKSVQSGVDTLPKPGYCALISPWTVLLSEKHQNTKSDYLHDGRLHLYGSQYVRKDEDLQNPLASPGTCRSIEWWQQAAPTSGFYCTFGSEEVLGQDIKDLLRLWRKARIPLTVEEEAGGIHAWVIARLFLEQDLKDRVRGIKDIVRAIRANIPA